MQYFRLAPGTKSPVLAVIYSRWDRWMMSLARKYARNQAVALNRAMYGSKMFNSIIVYSSVEKADINAHVPKGNKMNHADVLKHMVFLYRPEEVRKKIT